VSSQVRQGSPVAVICGICKHGFMVPGTTVLFSVLYTVMDNICLN